MGVSEKNILWYQPSLKWGNWHFHSLSWQSPFSCKGVAVAGSGCCSWRESPGTKKSGTKPYFLCPRWRLKVREVPDLQSSKIYMTSTPSCVLCQHWCSLHAQFSWFPWQNVYNVCRGTVSIYRWYLQSLKAGPTCVINLRSTSIQLTITYAALPVLRFSLGTVRPITLASKDGAKNYLTDPVF